ncbi:iron ABC transporter permease [Corynebacterium sp. CCM 8862]|uniref:Iron ABC transporter permease n=1 Tax=Corynebacterium mendelii TaxID=2765362 RepID=A0A939IZ22_9CORY|nr:iron ABC transporter permease [Corynebacterium mendelii]
MKISVLVVLFVLTPALTITFGPAAVPAREVFGVIGHHLFGDAVPVAWEPITDAIVWKTRLPRIVTGLAVGVILGVSGVVMQAVVRNPLAEPYVLGVSSGASTGAALAMITFGMTSSFLVGSVAFAGAVAATVLVIAIGGGSGSTALQLILAGLAVGFGFQSLTNIIVFSSDNPETARAVLFFTLGSLGRADWNDAVLVSVTALLLTVFAFIAAPVLDAVASGDKTAQTVGVNPGAARLLLLVPVSAAVAAAVSVAGGIGFIGLVVPHMIRSAIGYGHRLLVLGSAVTAALFLVWADAIARVVFAPAELPIGVMTGLIGVPFLVVLVRRLPGAVT